MDHLRNAEVLSILFKLARAEKRAENPRPGLLDAVRNAVALQNGGIKAQGGSVKKLSNKFRQLGNTVKPSKSPQ